VFASASGVLGQLLAQLLHPGHRGGVYAIGLVLGFFVFKFLSHVGLLRCTARAERLLYLLRQAMLQVLVDLTRAGVEDAVDTEVQLGAVNLENLTQFGDEFSMADPTTVDDMYAASTYGRNVSSFPGFGDTSHHAPAQHKQSLVAAGAVQALLQGGY
jgi:hypothetical protein